MCTSTPPIAPLVLVLPMERIPELAVIMQRFLRQASTVSRACGDHAQAVSHITAFTIRLDQGSRLGQRRDESPVPHVHLNLEYGEHGVRSRVTGSREPDPVIAASTVVHGQDLVNGVEDECHRLVVEPVQTGDLKGESQSSSPAVNPRAR